MKAWDLQRAIMRDRWRRNFVLPNYTASRWFESDVFELTDSGYFREYEIKISRADFFADAKKQQEVLPRAWGEPVVFLNKHALLNVADVRGPSQFWFVTPVGLLKPEEVPPFAGLIEISESSGRLYDHERVKAPRLHRVKFERQGEHNRGVCYWRMHGEFGTEEPRAFIGSHEQFDAGAGI